MKNWIVGEYDPITDKTDLEKEAEEFAKAKEELKAALLEPLFKLFERLFNTQETHKEV